MNTKSNRGLTLGSLLVIGGVVVAFIVALLSMRVYTVDGNEVGVRENWQGVAKEPVTPGTYFYFFGPTTGNTKVYTYPTSGRVFVMNDKVDKTEPFAEGRQADSLEINSLDNQKVRFHIIVTWRINPSHVIALHTNYRDNIEERLIRPEVVRSVGTRATVQQAIDLYSGPKLNQLRQEVETELKSLNGKLATSGIIVDSFIFEKPEFPNIEYVKAIEARQLAIIQESQAREQQKANLALAEAAKAKAMTEQNQELVKAETAKQRSILEQQALSEKAIIEAAANAKNLIVTQNAESEKVVIAAKAEAARNIAISEAQKQAELNRAVSIEAVGKATAESNKLLLSSYAVPGSDLYTRIQVAQSLATSFANVKGYLPQGVTYNVVSGDFNKGVNLLVGSDSK
jgi:regulator of protease activity HflC (stomatin/prohibitin superfamily)